MGAIARVCCCFGDTVSYTHLDVYKRQVTSSAFNLTNLTYSLKSLTYRNFVHIPTHSYRLWHINRIVCLDISRAYVRFTLQYLLDMLSEKFVFYKKKSTALLSQIFIFLPQIDCLRRLLFKHKFC